MHTACNPMFAVSGLFRRLAHEVYRTLTQRALCAMEAHAVASLLSGVFSLVPVVQQSLPPRFCLNVGQVLQQREFITFSDIVGTCTSIPPMEHALLESLSDASAGRRVTHFRNV